MRFELALFVIAATSFALSAGMWFAWLVWGWTKNSGWIDTVWTFSVGTIAIVGAAILYFLRGNVTARPAIVSLLVLAWTLRLGTHIAMRTSGITDDPRYAKLIRDWRQDAGSGMFWLLQKQAWVSIPLVLAILLASANPFPTLRIQDWLGVVILVVAIIGEATADRQLREFRSRNPGSEVCSEGLWAWSRHPNYFFQWFGWLAYPLIAVDLSGAYVWGWLALSGPIFMYWLLAHVSGIPPLEEHMLSTRGQKYRDYMNRTRAFLPLPPRDGT